MALSTGTELIDKINAGILGQDKAFFEGIAALRLKKITKYWHKRPKWILSINSVPVLNYKMGGFLGSRHFLAKDF